jgi:hypothetical protein
MHARRAHFPCHADFNAKSSSRLFSPQFAEFITLIFNTPTSKAFASHPRRLQASMAGLHACGAIAFAGRLTSQLHDALPSCSPRCPPSLNPPKRRHPAFASRRPAAAAPRSALVGDDLRAASPGATNGSHAPHAKEPLLVAPEDFVLPPGELSAVDRSSPPSPADTFRCPGCTVPECQVGGGHCCIFPFYISYSYPFCSRGEFCAS